MTGLLCYNRGCGKTFNPRDNPPDSQDCIHHPGAPFFHETYKGWTCCNKKWRHFIHPHFPMAQSKVVSKRTDLCSPETK